MKSYPMHCLIRSNVGDVKMMNIVRSSRHTIFFRKLKINSMSIRTCNVEYIMAQKDNKSRCQKCDFHLSTPL